MPNQNDESSDAEIIRRVLAGDVNAFELLIKRYQAHVFSIVRKHVPKTQADEVAHDVFVRAYQGLGGFSEKSGFSQWLAGIAIRTSYDFWRREYRRREIPASQLTDAHREYIENTVSGVSAETFEQDGRRLEAVEILEWALNRMSAPDRMVLELVYLEEYSHREAAELLGWSVVNVKVRAYRARKKLARILLKEQSQKEVSP